MATPVLLYSYLENVLERAVVLLQDGVLGAQVEGETAVKGVLETAVGEVLDRGLGVVHA